MKYFPSLVLLLLMFSASGQANVLKSLSSIADKLYAPEFSMTFNSPCVTQYDQTSTKDPIMTQWESINCSEYKVDKISNNFSFVEWDSTGTELFSVIYRVIDYYEDEGVIQYVLTDCESTIHAVISKDRNFLVLIMRDSMYEISNCEGTE